MWRSLKIAYKLSWRLMFRSSFSISDHILFIAMITLAVSVASMLSTVSLVRGFDKVVHQKLYALWGSHRVLPSSMANGPLDEYYGKQRSEELEKEMKSLHIPYDAFSSVFALSQTRSGVEGVMLKSFDHLKRWEPFIVKKFIPKKDSNYSVYISEVFSHKYSLDSGGSLLIHLLPKEDVSNTATRVRRVNIAGIYRTGVAEHDGKVILCRSDFLHRLGYVGIGGYELFIDPEHHAVGEGVQRFFLSMPLEWSVLPIQKILPDLFDWIAYATSTEWIFFTILSILVFVNLVIGFMLFVVDRSKTIGVLLAVGYGKRMIYAVFFIGGMLWCVLGMILGVLLTVGFLYIQSTFGLIKLDENIHYIAQAMIYIDWVEWLWILSLICLISMLSLIVPARIASSYAPTKVLTFV